jgi:hypothetical protein
MGDGDPSECLREVLPTLRVVKGLLQLMERVGKKDGPGGGRVALPTVSRAVARPLVGCKPSGGDGATTAPERGGAARRRGTPAVILPMCRARVYKAAADADDVAVPRLWRNVRACPSVVRCGRARSPGATDGVGAFRGAASVLLTAMT